MLCDEPAFSDPDPDFEGTNLCAECLECEIEGDIDYQKGCLVTAKKRLKKLRKKVGPKASPKEVRDA